MFAWAELIEVFEPLPRVGEVKFSLGPKLVTNTVSVAFRYSYDCAEPLQVTLKLNVPLEGKLWLYEYNNVAESKAIVFQPVHVPDTLKLILQYTPEPLTDAPLLMLV
jgi:hypothetical protein